MPEDDMNAMSDLSGDYLTEQGKKNQSLSFLSQEVLDICNIQVLQAVERGAIPMVNFNSISLRG